MKPTRGVIPDGETYEAYIERLATDPIARHVKLADLADNLANNRRQEPTADIGTRIERYKKARRRQKAATNIYTIGMVKVIGSECYGSATQAGDR